MASPTKKPLCFSFSSCFKPQPLNTTPKAPVPRTEFQAAIGNYHRKVASTDVLTDRQFLNWTDASYQTYMKERDAKK